MIDHTLLAKMRAFHQPFIGPLLPPALRDCGGCGAVWPCEPAALIAEVDRRDEAIAACRVWWSGVREPSLDRQWVRMGLAFAALDRDEEAAGRREEPPAGREGGGRATGPSIA